MGGPRINWSPDQIEAVRTRYPNEDTETLAAELGKTRAQVYRLATSMGLKKSADYLATDKSGRILKGGKRGQMCQFKPGQTPWNKGLKGVNGVSQTRFKPGQMPQTWQPIGTVAYNKEGLPKVKIDDTRNKKNDWILVHVKVWIDANGPVPPGHIVVFKPGMRVTEPDQITVDRLECISKAENMRRNTVHRLPKELAMVIQLQGVLRRQINKRTKKQ